MPVCPGKGETGKQNAKRFSEGLQSVALIQYNIYSHAKFLR